MVAVDAAAYGRRVNAARRAGGLLHGLRPYDHVLGRVQDLEPIADEVALSLAQLPVAWGLQNDNVAAAIWASRPEQVTENVRVVGVRIPAELMARIDDVLGDVIERDPGKTAEQAPQARVA